MADINSQPETTDTKTRANLAYIFAFGSIFMLCYILFMWGNQKEILTLIIGLIGGTLLGSVSGVYFGGSSQPKKPDTNTTVVTGDSPSTTVNNPPTNNTPPATATP